MILLIPQPQLVETEFDIARNVVSLFWLWNCVHSQDLTLSVLCKQVKYASLPNFEDREEEFLAESVLLRRRFATDGTSAVNQYL